MARTPTRTPARAAAQQPWPRRREREGGIAPPADGAAPDRPPAVRPGSIPQQGPHPASPSPRPGPSPVPRPGTVAQGRTGTPLSPEALLAGVPPFGTPPYGTGRSTAGPQGHPAAAGRSPQLAPRNGFGVTALRLALALLALCVGVAGLVVLLRLLGAPVGDGPYRLGGLFPVLSPAGADVPAGPAVTGARYTFRVSGTAPGATVTWGVGGTSGADQVTRLPWDRTAPGRPSAGGTACSAAVTCSAPG